MHPDANQRVRSVIQLMKRGRFSQALDDLMSTSRVTGSSGRSRELQNCLLAECLQRVGKNHEAERIATQCLQLTAREPETAAHLHYVLGAVYRETGDLPKAIGHLQIADRYSETDPNLNTWTLLRLMATIAELGGSEAALTQLSKVKQALTKLADPRAFVAFHLLISEIESTYGNLRGARKHLEISQQLLEPVDDVWLRGYFAINSFGVSFHSGDISSSQEWASLAISCSEISGHRASRRAANANLGHVQFSLGHFREAELSFQLALKYCDVDSPHHTAILDSLAQIKLQTGDLSGCRSLLNELGLSTTQSLHSKETHYKTWAMQTQIQLFLREGRPTDALALCDRVWHDRSLQPQARLTTVLQLAAIETLLALGDTRAAAEKLVGLLQIDLPPDLSAASERMLARLLHDAGSPLRASQHVARAIRTYETIGHKPGQTEAQQEANTITPALTDSIDNASAALVLDNLKSLFDARRQPRLFAVESAALLNSLSCANDVRILDGDQIEKDRQKDDEASGRVFVELGNIGSRKLSLSFTAKPDPAALISCHLFKRTIEQIINISDRELLALEDFWSTDGLAAGRDTVFASEKMLTILKTLKKIAPSNLSVLLTGETGTGKEVLARSIHELSGRTERPFLAVNCSAIPRDLLESHLFGHRRGAFSGANEHFQGVVKAADGGTLLLDEVGEIPLEIQPKLLRFLESHEIHPLGDTHPTKVDVRLVFATNTDLESAVRDGRFRQDLFFRINILPIKVPPLRERRDEIPTLVKLFVEKLARDTGLKPIRFGADAMEALLLYSWPGNVRQLWNEIRRIAATEPEGALITRRALGSDITQSQNERSVSAEMDQPTIVLDLNQSLSEAIGKLERMMVSYALDQSRGHVSLAAAMLGLSRKGLYLKRQRMGLFLKATAQGD